MAPGTRKTLLFVSPSAYTLSGLAVWLDYLLPGLERKDFRCVLGLVEGSYHHKPSEYLKGHSFHSIERIQCFTGTQTGRLRAIRKAIKRTKPDAILSVNIPESILAIRGVEQRPHGIITIHGIQPDIFADANELREAVDGIICTNHLACRLARKICGISSERVHYASCGAKPSPIARQNGKQGNPFRVLYAGRLEQPQKRVLDLVEIALELRRRDFWAFQFVVAGNGPSASELASQIKLHQLEANFVTLGELPPNQVKEKLMAECDALIITSSWETGPIVAWEALAQRLCVITSRYKGLTSEGALVHEKNCLVFEVAETVKAADHIIAMATHSQFRLQISQSGLDTFQNRYTHERSIELWADSIHSVLSQPQQSCILGSSSLRHKTPTTSRDSSRLERLLGKETAETVRTLLGRKQQSTTDAGDEWPHTISPSSSFAPNFEKLICELDANI